MVTQVTVNFWAHVSATGSRYMQERWSWRHEEETLGEKGEFSPEAMPHTKPKPPGVPSRARHEHQPPPTCSQGYSSGAASCKHDGYSMKAWRPSWQRGGDGEEDRRSPRWERRAFVACSCGTKKRPKKFLCIRTFACARCNKIVQIRKKQHKTPSD